MENLITLFENGKAAQEGLDEDTMVRLGYTFDEFQQQLDGREDFFMDLLPLTIQAWIEEQAEGEGTEIFKLVQGKSINMDSLFNIMDKELKHYISESQLALTYHFLYLEW